MVKANRSERLEDKLKGVKKALEDVGSYKLNPDEMYKHCFGCGVIYEGDYKEPLVDLYKLTGEKEKLPYKPFEYNITSGVCPPCLYTIKENRKLYKH